MHKARHSKNLQLLRNVVGDIAQTVSDDSDLGHGFNGEWTMDNGQPKDKGIDVHCSLTIVHCLLHSFVDNYTERAGSKERAERGSVRFDL
jgi:hypothetical protein